MKCLFLAAGFATRLYPLTRDFPKPLLKIGEKNILERLLDNLVGIEEIDGYCVVTNAKFASIFRQWASSRPEKIEVVDDGAKTNETRLGAVRDMIYAIETLKIDDDVLALAGDNLIDFNLTGFARYARMKNASCGMRYWEPDVERLRRSGVAEIDADDRVVRMTEKPNDPKSHWCMPPFYFYRRVDLPLVKRSVDEGCGADAPGSLLAWLADRTPVYAYLAPGSRLDVGSLESYREAQRLYEERDHHETSR